MTLQELIAALSHIRDLNPSGESMEVKLTYPIGEGEWEDAPMAAPYVSVGYVFIGVADDDA